MASQSYAMIYHDTESTTLNEALRILAYRSNPILQYRQTISIQNPYYDITYQPYIVHDIDNKQITLSFPPICTWISNLQNSKDCKMVMYYKEFGYIKEIIITSLINIHLRSDTKIIIYTKGHTNLTISFDVYLMKKMAKL